MESSEVSTLDLSTNLRRVENVLNNHSSSNEHSLQKRVDQLESVLRDFMKLDLRSQLQELKQELDEKDTVLGELQAKVLLYERELSERKQLNFQTDYEELRQKHTGLEHRMAVLMLENNSLKKAPSK